MRDYKWCYRPNAISDSEYIDMTKDCKKFKMDRGYNKFKSSKEEKKFPIAYSILVYKSAEQTERLLRAIYRPHNVYCIHVDAKASESMQSAIKSIGKCFQNVLTIENPISVRWAEITVVQAELMCLKKLYNSTTKWKYLINLTGQDFPLKTNKQLVKILHAFNGGNDVDGTPHKRPIAWTEYSWRTEWWRTNSRKGPVPHEVLITKGSAHMAVSRKFIGYVLNSKIARDLLYWMADIRVPDEHYFSSLNHSPHLKVPGSYKGNPDLKPFVSRYKIWWTKVEKCSGTWQRFICIIGLGDLYRLADRYELFVNKFDIDQDPLTLSCMEEWFYKRNEEKTDLNVSFYKNLPFVKNHV
ncbi:unnamed protein product [Dimorphilus gyrociliatus]|uniref:Uncharacterized protein n=1 Tax=Dimorphilus gyrociliatus TaxID=2664684 RepID=A0A7I8VD51_9ANNE|nr:unnamed protein product [Dimorphilus gyrociliatus]